MPIPIRCPRRNTLLNVPETALGKRIKCPAATCGEVFEVPQGPPTQLGAPQGIATMAPAPVVQPVSPAYNPPPVRPVQRRGYDPRDDDDDEYDDPRPRRRMPPRQSGSELQTGLGIGSLIVGCLGVVIAMMPCLFFAGIGFAVLGLVLGVAGIIVAFTNERRGLALPITGAAVNVLAFGLAFVWWYLWVAAARRFADDFANRSFDAIQKAADENKKRREMSTNGHPEALNNLRTIAEAMHKCGDQRRWMPASGGTSGKLSWRVELLPYLGEAKLYKEFKLDEPWDGAHNIKLLDRMPAVYGPLKQGDPDGTRTHYQLFTKPGGPFPLKGTGPSMVDIIDGTSNTLMVVEAFDPVLWTKPEDLRYDPKGPLPKFGYLLPNGFHAVRFDGKARFIQRTTPQSNIRAWITASGKEPVPQP